MVCVSNWRGREVVSREEPIEQVQDGEGKGELGKTV